MKGRGRLDDAGLLQDWLDEVDSPEWTWFYKRLTANDTGATGGHQAGFHIPNAMAFRLFPELAEDAPNPRVTVSFRLASHGQDAPVSQLVYYNQRTRNECRMTGFGGRGSALLDPDSTGAILLVAFRPEHGGAEAWLADKAETAEVLEGVLGEVEPGVAHLRTPDRTGQMRLFEAARTTSMCAPLIADLPAAWAEHFPTGRELAAESVRRVPWSEDVDHLLLTRHACEYALFKVVEEFHVTPGISGGFSNVEDFLATAQSVLQRRKSRAGKSLELQVETILEDARISFDHQQVTENGHRPDFIFPSVAAYRASARGDPRIVVLAVKSTLRDRWRQILHEADKASTVHLLTLDEGISPNHFREMAKLGVQLVVPEGRMRSYDVSTRASILSFGRFVRDRAAATTSA